MSFVRHTAALLALVAAPAMAQTSLTVGPTGGTPNTAYQRSGGLEITQSGSTDVVGGGVACALQAPAPAFTTENSYLRVFDLSFESLPEAISVNSLDIGVGVARLDSVAAGFVDTQVILYRLAAGTNYEAGFSRDALTEVARTTFRVEPIEVPGAVFNAPLTSPAAFGPTDLMVVEWFVPDGTAPQDSTGYENGFNIRYGYNDVGGASGSTYLSTNYNPESTSCGGLDPTPVQALGPTFADLHWVLVVNANLGVASEGGAVGHTVRLGDAVPNPSVSGSLIPFTLETASQARVSVYDVLGREVAVLADGAFGAGTHTARLAPGTLPAGTYVVRLSTPATTLTQTLTVTR